MPGAYLDASFALRGCRVKKASDYRTHADECRTLAKQMTAGPQRDQLIAMAETRDHLAVERGSTSRVADAEQQDPPESPAQSD